jgi:hypothetical protein
MAQTHPRSVTEERAEHRLRRFKSDPLKFQLIRYLWVAPRKYESIPDLLGVGPRDARRVLRSLLREGLVVERHAGAELVYAVSEGISTHAFISQLLRSDIGEEPGTPA